MLTIYRRHLKACPHKSRYYRRCQCPVWVQGTLRGETIREALDLTSWEAATNVVREWEAKGKLRSDSAGVPTITEAIAKHLADAKARNLREPTIRLIQTLIEKSFLAWCEDKGYRYLSEIGVDEAREFRASWTFAPITAAKKLERLSSFFRFCHDAGWIDRNPVKAVGRPKLTQVPTMPFTEEEFRKLLAASDQIQPKGVHSWDTPKRIRAFLLLLRYSGLRRTDAVGLHRDRITDGKLFLYTQKTGVPVRIPLPQFVIDAMEEVRKGEYYFWSGNGNIKSATSAWDRAFRRVTKRAGVQGHFHMFRDTFAVELLLAGVPLDQVSVLLGHSSVKITEKSYAPWVKARQEQLEAAVMKTWKESPRLQLVSAAE
jgi:integrase/recombinase XerD